MPAKPPAVLLLRPAPVRWDDVDFGVPDLLSVGGWIAARAGVRVELLDLAHETGDRRDLAQELDQRGPFSLIGVWADSAFELWRALALGRFLRARHPDVPLVAGGRVAAALAGDLLAVFDRVVPGEGEREMADLAERPPEAARGEVRVAEARAPTDLAAGPPVRIDWLERSLARAPAAGGRLRVEVARGTPGRGARCRPVEHVVDALDRISGLVDLGRFWVELEGLSLLDDARLVKLLEALGPRAAPLAYVGEVPLGASDDVMDSLARARCRVRIPLPSGSDWMLRHAFGVDYGLDEVRDLARRAQSRRVPWTVEITVGHPGETLGTAMETREAVRELFDGAPSSHGWLHVAPFRLLPGSAVHAQLARWETAAGARFHHPTWWRERYDGPFRAQHVEPSAVFGYAARVRWMHDEYGPLLALLHERYAPVSSAPSARSRLVYRHQRAEIGALSRAERDRRLDLAFAARQPDRRPLARAPRDPAGRALERAMRTRLDRGLRVSDRLIDAVFEVAPDRWLAPRDARAMLRDSVPEPPAEGWSPTTVGLGSWLVGMEALAPVRGERALDLTARAPHVAAVLAELVGEQGQVVAVAPDGATADSLRASLVDRPRVEVIVRGPAHRFDVPGRFDVVWLGAALPRVPPALRQLLTPDGRAFVAVGPRHRPQRLVLVQPGAAERTLGSDRFPVLGGVEGWLPWPRDARVPPVQVKRAEGPARFFATLAELELEAADPVTAPEAPWARVVASTWPNCRGRALLPRLGLAHLDVQCLVRALRGPPRPLSDRAGRALCAAIAMGIEDWPGPVRGFGTVSGGLLDQLEGLRAALWARQGLRPPPLVLLDVPALGGRARAAAVGGSWHVATSLAMPEEHVLMQLLHEEVHLVTDPEVLTRAPESLRSPRRALWRRLERSALDATVAFLHESAPDQLPAFERWRRAVASRDADSRLELRAIIPSA